MQIAKQHTAHVVCERGTAECARVAMVPWARSWGMLTGATPRLAVCVPTRMMGNALLFPHSERTLGSHCSGGQLCQIAECAQHDSGPDHTIHAVRTLVSALSRVDGTTTENTTIATLIFDSVSGSGQGVRDATQSQHAYGTTNTSCPLG
jgi:hypothetical protein